jgi:hypothetical protein
MSFFGCPPLFDKDLKEKMKRPKMNSVIGRSCNEERDEERVQFLIYKIFYWT